MESDKLELNQKTIIGPARLSQIMPSAGIDDATEFISAGPLTFGIEYRFLTRAEPEEGVCVHVFEGKPERLSERLRFDCFDEDPHYHYHTLYKLISEFVFSHVKYPN